MSIERQWHVKEYADDIHNYLRQKELLRFAYHGNSHHLPLRKPMVLWMSELSDRLHFCTAVKHLAVYFFDMFMDHHHLGNHLQLLALGCLIVAVKVEDDALTPRNSTFNEFIGNQYKLSEFVDMEVNILKFFKWEVMIPTTAHFIEYYVLYVFSPSDTIEGKLITDPERLKLYVERYIDYFLKIVLLDVVFYKFSPSLVAAACILSTRYCLSVSPPWSLSLQNLTYYKYAHLKPCMDILLRTLNTEAVVNIATQVQDSASHVSANSNSVYVLQS